jgi:hypothetical protein
LGFDPIEDPMSWDRFGALFSTTGHQGPADGPELHCRIGNLSRRDALPGRLRYDRAADC